MCRTITIRLMGGLGNQMFQYAFGYSLAKSLGVNINFDTRFYKYTVNRIVGLSDFRLTNFSFSNHFIPLWLLNLFLFRKILARLIGLYYENSLHYDENILREKNYRYYCGYFQSEKYFSNIRELLLSQFIPIKSLNITNSLIEYEIKNSISISLHVRRGDYLTDRSASEVHGTCDDYYYANAIQIMMNHFPECRFFIFSDDIDWVKKNMNIPGNPIFIDNNEQSPVIDMYLMSLCDHNIIANSTFSWWGAWLNKNADKLVIAPKRWFKNMDVPSDLLPNSWMAI